MTLANDLVQFLMQLFGDRQAAQDFLDDPERVLEDHGLGGVCSADVDAAMPVVLDYAPVTINASRFDRDYNTGGNSASTDHNGGGGYTPPPAGGGHGGGHHDNDDHAHAIQQLHHVVNNYSYTSTVDDRDTITDQSVNQNIWADGDVRQWFDNDSVVASGDRAIAAGDDADVEDSNNIEDSYNTDNSSDHSTNNSIHAGGDVNIGNERTDIDDSFNTDVDLDADIRDSFNDNSDKSTEIDVKDSGNDNSINDSLNDNSDRSVDVDAHLENIGNTDRSINDSLNDNSDRSIDVDATLENFGNTDNSMNDSLNDSLNSETVDVGGVDLTHVEVGDVDAELTNIENSFVVAENDLDVTAAVAGNDATIED